MSTAAPPPILSELETLLRSRLAERPEGSYTTRLLVEPTLVQRKIMEESFEVCLELQAAEPDRAATASEAADLVFHLLTALVGAGVAWADVEAVLADRFGKPARDSSYGTEAVDR